MLKRLYLTLAGMFSTLAGGAAFAQEAEEAAPAAAPPEPITVANATEATVELADKIKELVILYGLNLLAAIAIFVIGKWVAKLLRGVLVKMLQRGKVDETLIKFISNLAYSLLLVFVVIAAINRAGIQTTSLIAILGAAGLAIGMALQGSLSNFAAGVMLIIFRPFKVGDFVEGGGTAGTIEEIGIFTTVMKTADNKQIIIPNAAMSGGNITNYSAHSTRRVDVMACIGYDDDIDRAREILKSIIDADERVLKDPEPLIAVAELADSSVNLTVRVWVNSADYWGVTFHLNEQMKKKFDDNGISIPYPQQDVHMHQAG